jgi:hypothetical protein
MAPMRYAENVGRGTTNDVAFELQSEGVRIEMRKKGACFFK